MHAASGSPVALDEDQWRDAEAVHRGRADVLTAGHRKRAARGEKHPVEDFLFTYYSYKPALLRRWHPGADVVLRGAANSERAGWRWYRPGPGDGTLVVDAAGFVRERPMLVDAVARLLGATASRPAGFGCFGLHEWAMVYREGVPRHDVPLRLGRDGTDAVVRANELRCTHFDAFRFFTPAAVPLNRTPLTRADQPRTEQPGCLHAGMDLYKWAVKLGPLVPGALLLDAFELARDIRELDMRASPYDLRGWGYEPIRIETPEGKAEYVRRQRAFSVRAQPVRAALLAAAAPA
ncbi:hypothetical protein P0L94_04455 [Microbacter sp. GSS18]|nr:hypothetical protein P0L94_04455 [Microbacter sp. GSS18]